MKNHVAALQKHYETHNNLLGQIQGFNHNHQCIKELLKKKRNHTLHSIHQNIRNIDLLFKNIHKQPQVGPNDKNDSDLNESGH